MQRRDFLKGTSAFAALSLAGCAPKHAASPQAAATAPALPFYDLPGPIVPIRAHEDRIFRITVCLRPFRMAGPRMDTEKVGDKLVVHNYGHGGSGWSLSWGSGKLAVEKAMHDGEKDIAILGCGALGLTAATVAQRAGARVTIYAKERPPEVRSARATGAWTPDSRIAFASKAAPGFAQTWEQMARTSWSMYQSYLGMPGTPIEFTDRYLLQDEDAPGGRRTPEAPPTGPNGELLDFARYADSIRDLTPRSIALPPGTHPFPTKYAYRNSQLTFNVADYSRQLMNDFFIAGGRIETTEFHTPQDLAALPQKVIINCTGYGARSLWQDESIIPVRGQIAWLIPQEDAHYGIYYKGLNVLARRDGIVIQGTATGEADGWRRTDETPDRADADANVRILQELYNRMGNPPRRS